VGFILGALENSGLKYAAIERLNTNAKGAVD
jgi:hypothetical protein